MCLVGRLLSSCTVLFYLGNQSQITGLCLGREAHAVYDHMTTSWADKVEIDAN